MRTKARNAHAKSRLAILAAVVIFVSGAECRAVETVLPRTFQGLWVDSPNHDACSEVKVARDAFGAGEGVLFLDGTAYYSQETACRVSIYTKSCCDAADDDTRGGTLVCGRSRTPIIFHLHRSADGGRLTVAEFGSGVNGPSVKTYQRCGDR
jgi:hypothetical protein